MKAILKFDLDDRDDRMAHLRCVKSSDMANVLFEVTHNLKKQLEDDGETGYNVGIEDTINRIIELMDGNGIIIDDLIE
jgi:hypothetical protein